MGTAILSIVWCYFRLPELKHKSFGELEILFSNSVPARHFKSTTVDRTLFPYSSLPRKKSSNPYFWHVIVDQY